MERRTSRRIANRRNNSISELAASDLNSLLNYNNSVSSLPVVLEESKLEMEGLGVEGAHVNLHGNLPPLQPVQNNPAAANSPAPAAVNVNYVPPVNVVNVDPVNQIVAALASNINRQPIGEMPTFSDVSKSGLPSTFISKVEQYARANKWNTIPNSSIEQEMLLAVPLKLKGAADSWFSDLDDNDEAKLSWEGFKIGLIARFTIPGQDAANFHIYSQRTQKRDEKVEEYAEALKKLIKNIANKAMVPEAVQVSKFVNGLEPMIRLQMTNRGVLPATFTEAVVQAILIESAYSQYREAKSEQRSKNNNNSGYGNKHNNRGNNNSKRNDPPDHAAAAATSSNNDKSGSKRPQRNYNNPDWKKNIKCYRCHNYGHFSNECPEVNRDDEKQAVKQERKQQMVRTNGSKDKAQTLAARDEVTVGKNLNANAVPTNVHMKSERNNEVPIIIGNVRTYAVLDSGADHNCISSDLYSVIKSLAGIRDELVPINNDHGHSYYGADGKSMKCLGEVTLSMEHVNTAEAWRFNWHVDKAKRGFDPSHEVRFSVVDGLVSSVLLGDEYHSQFIDAVYHRIGAVQLLNRQVVLFKNSTGDKIVQCRGCGSLSNVHYAHCSCTTSSDSDSDEQEKVNPKLNPAVVSDGRKQLQTENVTKLKCKDSDVNMVKPEVSVTVPPNTSQQIGVVAVVEAGNTNGEVLFEPKPRKRGLIARILINRNNVPQEQVEIHGKDGIILNDKQHVKIEFCTNVLNNTDDAIHFNKDTIIGHLEPPLLVINKDTHDTGTNDAHVHEHMDINNNTHHKILNINEKEECISDDAIDAQIDKGLTPSQHHALFSLIKRYKSVVAENPKAPRFTSIVEHAIDTGSHPPIKQRSYRTSHQVQQKIREEVNEMLNNGIIRPSNSPWASPVVLVLKKDGNVRFCTDYRKLNAITRKDSYPLPRIQETIDVIGKAKWFSTIDFCSGFWQIPVREADIPKTAFITRDGLYEYVRMPFGLCNSPSTFQRTMDVLLTGMNNRCALVYIDDILIFSNSFEDHLNDLEELFIRLVDTGFSIKLSKCWFGKREVDYLGHTINENGVSPDKKKLEAITRFPYPTNLTELRSFLGMLNYYNQFIQDFAHIASPLYQLTKKGVKFEMNDTCHNAVDILKAKLTNAPILRHPDFERPFIIYTDASNVALGVVLAQKDESGNEYVVAYGSRSLSSVERKYTVTERECLAVLFGVKIFRPYVYGTRFTVVTDHGSLTWLFKLRDPEGRLGRWSLKLQGMDMKIEHRAGTKHGNADGLSRAISSDNKLVGMVQHIYTFTPSPRLINVITRSRKQKDALLEQHKRDKQGTSTRSVTIINSPVHGPAESKHDSTVETKKQQSSTTSNKANKSRDNAKSHKAARNTRVNVRTDFSTGTNHSTTSTSLVEAAPLSTETQQLRERIKQGQQHDKEIKQLIDYIMHKQLPDNADPATTSRIRILASKHMMVDGLLHHIFQPTNLASKHEVKQQIVIPKAMRQEVMMMYHDSYVTGHYGADRTFQRLNERVYWDTMYQDVYNYCQSCITCARRKTPHRTKKLVQGTLPIADYPWQRVSVDVVGPLPVSLAGNSYVLVVTDWFTRWIEAWPMVNQQEETIAQLIVEEVCCRYGCPEYLHSDRGSNFLSALSTKMYQMFDIHKTATTSYHPQGNGITERANQTLVELLAMYAQDSDWDAYLPYCLAAIRSTVNSSTQFTPHYLMFAREMRLPSDILLGYEDTNYNLLEKTDYVDEMEYRMKHAHAKAKEHLQLIKNKRDESNAALTSLKEFNVGDLVMVYHPQPPRNVSAKLYSPWRGPYKVLARVGDVNYLIDLPDEDGRKPHNNIHAVRLKLYVDPSTTIPFIDAMRAGRQ